MHEPAASASQTPTEPRGVFRIEATHDAPRVATNAAAPRKVLDRTVRNPARRPTEALDTVRSALALPQRAGNRIAAPDVERRVTTHRERHASRFEDLVVLNAEMLLAGPDGAVTTSVGESLITEVGQHLLVSGSQGAAGVCNLTQAFTQSEADAWRAHLDS